MRKWLQWLMYGDDLCEAIDRRVEILERQKESMAADLLNQRSLLTAVTSELNALREASNAKPVPEPPPAVRRAPKWSTFAAAASQQKTTVVRS